MRKPWTEIEHDRTVHNLRDLQLWKIVAWGGGGDGWKRWQPRWSNERLLRVSRPWYPKKRQPRYPTSYHMPRDAELEALLQNLSLREQPNLVVTLDSKLSLTWRHITCCRTTNQITDKSSRNTKTPSRLNDTQIAPHIKTISLSNSMTNEVLVLHVEYWWDDTGIAHVDI